MRASRLRLLPLAFALGLAAVALAAVGGPAAACPGAEAPAACCPGDGVTAPAPPDGETDPGAVPCAGGACPDGCAHCHLPCCAGLVFAPGGSAATAMILAPSGPDVAPAAAPLPGRLATRDLDRPPRA